VCHALTLQGLLEQVQVFSFFVEPVLQLTDLLELHSLIHKELSLVLLGRELDMRWRVPSFDCLFVLRLRRAFNIDVEAFTGQIIGVVSRVGVRSAKVVV
jgi:hypothetical protein